MSVDRRARRIPGGLITVLALLFLTSVTGLRADEPDRTVDDYVIGVEDELSISVWREAEISGRVIVRPDGKITVPLVGDIQAAGRTASQVAAELKTLLSRYIKEPVVSVIVSQINSFKVYVIGEVNRQGVLELRQRVRLLQALALAGGLTQFAEKSKVVLVREENGREMRRVIDYRRLIREEGSSENVYLKPGDLIIAN